MTKRRGIESLEGVTKTGMYNVPVDMLRFWTTNQRIEYGFTAPNEERCVELVKKALPVLAGENNLLSEEEKNFLLDNLGNPDEGLRSMIGLAESVSADGIREPLRGYLHNEEEFIITSGNRRLASLVVACLMGLTVPERVPFRPEPSRNEWDLLKSQVLANGGRPYTAYEEARLYLAGINLGKSEEEVASHLANGDVGKVKRRLKLLECPTEVQQQVQVGMVRPTVAVEIVESGLESGYTEEAIVEAVAEAVAEAKGNNKSKASKQQIETKLKQKLPTREQREIVEVTSQEVTQEMDRLTEEIIELVRNGNPSLETLKKAHKLLRKDTQL